jgi:hypothetical protein
MVHLSNGTLATDIDAHNDNAHLTALGEAPLLLQPLRFGRGADAKPINDPLPARSKKERQERVYHCLPIITSAEVGAGSTPPSAPREERGRSSPVLTMLAMLGRKARPARGSGPPYAEVEPPRRPTSPLPSATGWHHEGSTS